MSAHISSTSRFETLPAAARTALSHVEFILSSTTTAALVTAIGEARSGLFCEPFDLSEPAASQYCAHGVAADVVREVLSAVGHNTSEELMGLLDAATKHHLRLYVDHHFSNRESGAIGRILEDDEW